MTLSSPIVPGMEGNIIFAVLVFFAAAIIIGIVRGAVLARRAEEIVRDWARKNGYAILSIERQGRLSDYALFLLLGWLGLILGPIINLGSYDFRVLIQDEQGGQTHVMVCVGKTGQPVDVRWDYYPRVEPWWWLFR